MKFLKKISYVILIAILLVVQANTTEIKDVEAKAKTLRNMKSELAELEKKLETNKQIQQSAKSGINTSKKRIEQISVEKTNIETDVDNLTNEISELNKDIVNMNEEMKEILNYYQVSNTGESTALSYVFDADDYTDLIYRMAISEQLSEHNQDTIDAYNKKISENENKKVELADKKKELNSKEVELESYIEEQQDKLESAMDGALSIEDEIAALKKTIDLYENTYKCKLDETIDQCLADKLPAGSTLYRPVVSGYISSNYGPRSYKLHGRMVSDFHYGVDFAGKHGEAIYSASAGKVAAIFKRRSCGGNMVYINHIINGKKYSTAYYHLATVNVSVGQNVTHQTVIGTRGGTSAEYWDGCSTGSHLHFSVSTGNWGSDYNSYKGYISRNINPRKVVNAPALGVRFDNRYKKY